MCIYIYIERERERERKIYFVRKEPKGGLLKGVLQTIHLSLQVYVNGKNTLLQLIM